MRVLLLMMNQAEITLIFPNQLFEDNPAITRGRTVALIEDELFFRQVKFHQKKLVLHRASMKAYEAELIRKRTDVRYFSSVDHQSLQKVISVLATEGVKKFHIVAPTDYLLERRLHRYSSLHSIAIQYYDSPSFICTQKYLDEFFASRKRYFLTDFYVEQRKRLNVLMEGESPAGGKWTFDTENRKKMPESVVPPALPEFSRSKYLAEAATYVRGNFSGHYGDTDNFIYPVTRIEARENLERFLAERFQHYGVYQDAIIDRNSFLFHSVLTPALNIGLLTPAEVIEETLAFARKKKIPINSLEGFVRQIVGWREFIRGLYIREGVRQRTTNHWEHTRRIPESFWNASTGIEPVDNVIRKVLKTSYANHIERLMVMGNFMLLCEFHPDDVYRWFMELFIDAYDWVMVPNVYGMSQFSDGGLMSTKPYISGSNYLLKMSNYKKGKWCETWDALYWHFINTHRAAFLKNPRMSMMVRQYDKMDKGRRKMLEQERKRFLTDL